MSNNKRISPCPIPRAMAALLFIASAALSGCGGGDDPVNASAAAPTQQALLSCNESMKSAFTPDANTSVLLVKLFKAGDALRLSGTVVASDPIAPNDMCFVKLLVGPGNPGPASAPSTSAGIGIEVWLPTPANWNNRIRVLGGGGWAGGVQTSLTSLVTNTATLPPWSIAGTSNEVSATTDTGHTLGDGTFAMSPDGTINESGWTDFSYRAIHEMAVKTKALATAYYGVPAKWAYWHAGSTGGRQGLKLAQVYPNDFNGIIANRPAINWSRVQGSSMYDQVVMQRDLNGVLLTTVQLNAVSLAAINSCDIVGTQHLGYLLDPRQCNYDPTQDASVICTSDGGTNGTASCVTHVQANTINKMWYGPTSDGSVPSPAADNGLATTLASKQRWYGLGRGTSLTTEAGANPDSPGPDQIALNLQDPTWATPTFLNATGTGQNRWKTLSYVDFSNSIDRGLALQGPFANIDTDNPDLSAFKAAGGKLISVTGWADNRIPPLG